MNHEAVLLGVTRRPEVFKTFEELGLWDAAHPPSERILVYLSKCGSNDNRVIWQAVEQGTITPDDIKKSAQEIYHLLLDPTEADYQAAIHDLESRDRNYPLHDLLRWDTTLEELRKWIADRTTRGF